jgi:hypothetical protein
MSAIPGAAFDSLKFSSSLKVQLVKAPLIGPVQLLVSKGQREFETVKSTLVIYMAFQLTRFVLHFE